MKRSYLGSQNGNRRERSVDALFSAMGKESKGAPRPKKITDEVKTIGIVPKLAPGVTNPMWAIEENLPSICKKVVPLLKPKKLRKRKATMSKYGNFTMVEVIEEEDIDSKED